MNYFIDQVIEKDFQYILNINQKLLPAVSSISFKDLTKLNNKSVYFKTLKIKKTIKGFLIAIPPNTSYKSINYIWFNKRFKSFIYVDRICIDLDTQNKGYGYLFYKDLLENIYTNFNRIVCEVNLIPKNLHSEKFHKKFGFEQIGTQFTDNGEKLVSLKEFIIEK